MSDRKLKREIKKKFRKVERICDSWFFQFSFCSLHAAIHYVNEFKLTKQFDIDYNIIRFYLFTLRFFFLLSDENILNKIYDDFTSCEKIKYKTVCELPFYFSISGASCKLLKKPLTIHTITETRIQNKIQLMFIECDNIINSLIILKKTVREFIISKYNECLKCSEYAEEECLSQEKLLLSLSKINKYNADINKLVTNIIMSPIQKHTFCISTRININVNEPLYEINEECIILRKKYQGTFMIQGVNVFQFLCEFMIDKFSYTLFFKQ